MDKVKINDLNENKEKKNSFLIFFSSLALLLFVVYGIFSNLKYYLYKYDIKALNSSLENISVNVEFDKDINKSANTEEEFFLCFNSFCLTPVADEFRQVYHAEFSNSNLTTEEEFSKGKVKTIFLAYPKNKILPEIKDIDLHVGVKSNYFNYSDIKKFEKKTFKIKTNENDELEYSALVLPFDSLKGNYKGLLNHACVLFLSLFYNFQAFIVPYFWLLVLFSLLFFKAVDFKKVKWFKFDKINKKNIFIFSFVTLFII